MGLSTWHPSCPKSQGQFDRVSTQGAILMASLGWTRATASPITMAAHSKLASVLALWGMRDEEPQSGAAGQIITRCISNASHSHTRASLGRSYPSPLHPRGPGGFHLGWSGSALKSPCQLTPAHLGFPFPPLHSLNHHNRIMCCLGHSIAIH